MPEAEVSLERLYFQTILLNRSYDFLYRCEPSIDTLRTEGDFVLLQ